MAGIGCSCDDYPLISGYDEFPTIPITEALVCPTDGSEKAED